MNLSGTHPLSFVEELVGSRSEELLLEFSKYSYHPQEIEDRREVFRLKASCLREVEEELKGLEKGKEIAFHSRVICAEEDKVKHLPLVDFAGSLDKRKVDTFRGVVGERIFKNIVFFESGRSYHGYVKRLISVEQWVEFMGTILLANLPDQPEIVDSRWVGHRLRAGYGALRWSCNSEQYLQLPTRVTRWEEEKAAEKDKVSDD